MYGLEVGVAYVVILKQVAPAVLLVKTTGNLFIFEHKGLLKKCFKFWPMEYDNHL